MGAHEIHGTGTLRHSEGGALTGKHLETYEQENREGLEIQQEMGSKEKSVCVGGDGGSKDNDSYTSGVMCLISLSNSAGWAGEGGSALESAQDECISVSLNTAATCTEHEKIENSVLQVVNKGALTRSGDGNDFFPGEGAKTTEETAGEDRVSNHEKVAKWPEVNRWQRWGGGEGRETSLQEVEGRREQSCNN